MNTWPELVISVAGLRHRDNLADLKRHSSSDAVVGIETVVQAHGLGITTSRIPDGADVHVRASLASSLTGGASIQTGAQMISNAVVATRLGGRAGAAAASPAAKVQSGASSAASTTRVRAPFITWSR